MARLASRAKGGFYELPDALIPLILAHLSAPHGGRILDPCAGDGVPLTAFARALHLEAYGVELHTERARQAGAELQTLAGRRLPFQDQPQRRLLAGDYRTLKTMPGSFTLLYANPPYDQDHEAGRLEYQWLRDTRPYLQPGGVLVLVIPQHVLGFPRLIRYLVSWFDELLIGRFPDPEYAAFSQIVVFGVRRAQVRPPDPQQVEHYRMLAQAGHALAVLSQAAHPTYLLPTPQVPPARFFFRSACVSLEEALAEARAEGVRTLPAWQHHLAPTVAAQTPVAPLMPLKVGHLAGLIAAGFLDRQVLADGPTRLLIRGRAYKQLTHRTYIEELPDGAQQVTTATETIVTDVTTLSPTGEITSLRGADLERFLARWMPSLTAQVALRYPPRYTFDYQGGPDEATLNQLSLARSIPIMGGYGLLPAQKHAAAALATRLRVHPDALLVGQVGTGKTTVGVATAALLGARRTLVLAPPHLVHKWVREAELVWPEVEATILTTVSEVQAWFARATARPQLAVLSYSRAKLASGWHHAYDWWEPSPSRALVRAGDHPTPNRPKRAALQRYLQRRGVRCPDCGTAVCDDEGLPLFPADLEAKRGRLSCVACGAALYQFDRRRRADQGGGSFRTYMERERQIRQTLASGDSSQMATLPTFPAPAGYARWPLARFIRQHYRGQVDLLLVDELHELKGDTTDQGLAFQDLAVASRKVLGLTGTIFGGKCSSLFHLLYRLAPEFRAAFTDTAAQGRRRLQSTRWGELYGVEFPRRDGHRHKPV